MASLSGLVVLMICSGMTSDFSARQDLSEWAKFYYLWAREQVKLEGIGEASNVL